MKLSKQQAAAILELHNKWQVFRELVATKEVSLHHIFDTSQKAITQEGIILLRKYQVAAMSLLPNGIPKAEEVAQKRKFIEQAMAQMMLLHQSQLLKELEENASRRLNKKQLKELLKQLSTQTPLAHLFINRLQEKVEPMKTLEDLRILLCILIAKYSLNKLLYSHYEKKENWEYYKKESSHLEQLQEDFQNLLQQLSTLIS